MGSISIVLRYHIKVALQNNAFTVLHPGCRRFADYYVANRIAICIKAVVVAKLLYEFHRLVLFFAGAGDLGERIKVFPYALRFQ